MNQFEETIDRKIQTILDWAELEQPEFDTTFVESLREQYEKNGRLSNKQIAALDKIIERWIDK